MKLIEEQQRVAKYFKSFKTAQDDSTPLALAQEMVSKIPEEVIKNKDSRFLDPCAGTGTFLIALFDRLSKYHGAGHIMSNMLYGFDNTITSKTLLIKLGFKNIERLDFLNTELDMKFDVVIGNPPYSSNKKEPIRLWSRFIDYGLDILSEDGTLSFVTPSSWISSTNYSNSILKNRLTYVDLSNQVSDYFGKVGGTQRFIYFTSAKHSSDSCVTKFDNDIEIEFNPTETPFAPVKSSSYYLHSIVNKLYKSELSIHSWKRCDKVNTDPAVVVPMAKSRSYDVRFTTEDDLSISRYKLLADRELGEVIASNLNLEIYKEIRWAIRSGAAIAGNFKQLPIPSKLVTNEELYSILNLTEEEVEYANSLK